MTFAGVLPPLSGEVTVDGIPTGALSEAELLDGTLLGPEWAAVVATHEVVSGAAGTGFYHVAHARQPF